MRSAINTVLILCPMLCSVKASGYRKDCCDKYHQFSLTCFKLPTCWISCGCFTSTAVISLLQKKKKVLYWQNLLYSVLLFPPRSTCTLSHDSLCWERGQSSTLTLQESLVIEQITSSHCSAVSSHEDGSLQWRLHIFRLSQSRSSYFSPPVPLFLSLFPWPWLWL